MQPTFETLEPRMLLSGSAISLETTGVDFALPAIEMSAGDSTSLVEENNVCVSESSSAVVSGMSATVGDQEYGVLLITNTSDTSLSIDSYDITGSGADEFYCVLVDESYDVISMDTPISSQDSYYLYIFYTPSTTGSHEATLTLYTSDTDNPTIEVALSGTATTATGTTVILDEWYDAEKKPQVDDDDNLCWAGTASNMLAYSGWGIVGDFEDEYDIFDYFIDNTYDDGGYEDYACEWWIDGTIDYLNPITDWDAGGFYDELDASDYVFSTYYFTSSTQISGYDAMDLIASYIDQGYAVGLGVYGDLAHAITCWGYNVDPDTGEYLGIWVTDSDDDKWSYESLDNLRYYEIEVDSFSDSSFGLDGYGWCMLDYISDGYYAMIGSVAAISSPGATTFEITDSSGDADDLEVNFPSTQVGMQSTQSFEITNTGSEPLLVQDIDLGEDADDIFSWRVRDNYGNVITDKPETFAVLPGRTYTLEVIFSPSSQGIFSSNIYLQTNQSDSPVELTLTTVNYPPESNDSLEDQTAYEDYYFTYKIASDAFVDPNSDVLTYTITDGPDWLNISSYTRTLYGTPTNDDVGEVWVTIRATDPSGEYAEDSFLLTVINTNDIPVINVEPTVPLASEDTYFEYVLPANTFIDIDPGDSITYTVAGLPEWLSFDSETRTFYGTPDNSDVGENEFTLIATDQNETQGTYEMSINVENTNDAPVVNPEADLPEIVSTKVFEELQYTLPADAFIDDDLIHGDVLTLSVDGELPAWLSFDNETGTFTGTPQADDVEPLNITVVATDMEGATADFTFLLDITYETLEIDSGKWIFFEPDGDKVTVNLKNATGLVEYISHGNSMIEVISITVQDSTTRSSLTIDAKQGVNELSNGLADIETIEVEGSLAKLTAKTLNLTGLINIAGGIKKLDLGDAAGAEIYINSAGLCDAYDDARQKWTAYTTINIGAVSDTIIETTVPIKSLTVLDWQDTDEIADSVTAPWIGKITAKGQKDNRRTADVDESLNGDFAADVILTNADRKGTALGKISAKGIFSGDVDAGVNAIGTIKVGGWDADISAGSVNSISVKAGKGSAAEGDAAGNITITGTDAKGYALKSLTVKGSADGLSIDANDGAIGKITVGQWTTGAISAGVINTIKTKADKNREDVNGDFAADVTLDSTWYDQNFKPARFALSSANIANDLTGGVWNITGNMGTLKVKGSTGIDGSGLILNVLGNFKSLTTGGLFDSNVTVLGTLDKVEVKGWRVAKGEDIPAFTAGSTITADYIGLAKMKNWDTQNMTQLAVTSLERVGKLSYKDTRPESLDSWSWRQGKDIPWTDVIPIVVL